MEEPPQLRKKRLSKKTNKVYSSKHVRIQNTCSRQSQNKPTPKTK